MRDPVTATLGVSSGSNAVAEAQRRRGPRKSRDGLHKRFRRAVIAAAAFGVIVNKYGARPMEKNSVNQENDSRWARPSPVRDRDVPTVDISALQNLSSLLKSLGSIRDGLNDFACGNISTKGGCRERSDTNGLSTRAVVISPDAAMGTDAQSRERKNNRVGGIINRGLGKWAKGRKHFRRGR
jgi:hypothetical protein